MSKLPTVVGVVPAAGRGTRLVGVTGSKEVVKIGSREPRRDWPAAGFLLERFRLGGISQALVLLRSGKWDVPDGLGSGARWGVDLSYRIVDDSPSVPHTLDSAYPTVAGKVVALGFPDILFEPVDAFASCLERLASTDAAIVLGLFPTDQPEKTDMVELDRNGRPVDLVIKEPDCGLTFTWSLAVWRPRISELLRQWLTETEQAHEARANEPFVGDFLAWLIGRNEAIDAVRFEHGRYLDIGTPDDLEAARALY